MECTFPPSSCNHCTPGQLRARHKSPSMSTHLDTAGSPTTNLRVPRFGTAPLPRHRRKRASPRRWNIHCRTAHLHRCSRFQLPSQPKALSDTWLLSQSCQIHSNRSCKWSKIAFLMKYHENAGTAGERSVHSKEEKTDSLVHSITVSPLTTQVAGVNTEPPWNLVPG